jgi:hypothetical protein
MFSYSYKNNICFTTYKLYMDIDCTVDGLVLTQKTLVVEDLKGQHRNTGSINHAPC